MEMNVKLDIGHVYVTSDGVHWMISLFFDLPQEFNTVIKSPDLFYNNRIWNMVVYPTGVSQVPSPGWFGIAAIPKRPFSDPRVLTARLGIIGEGQEQKWISTAEHRAEGSGYGCEKLMSRTKFDSLRNQMVPGDHLHLFFSIENENEELAHSPIHKKEKDGNKDRKQEHGGACIEAATQTKGEIGFDKLSKDFREILLNGNMSDVVLKVGGQDFKAHRCILTARSPAFLATHETKDNIGDVLDIQGIDPSVFSEFLNYLYTGSVENLTSENAMEMYATADKYQVNELKNICTDHMMMNVSIENVCDVLSLSIKHKEEALKDVCIQFLSKKS